MSDCQAYDKAPWSDQYEKPFEPSDVVAGYDNLPGLIREAAEKYPDHIAFTACMANGMNGSLRYSEVEAMSDAFAVYLREELGLERGARVAVQMPNCLSFPVAAFGVLKAGCVLVNTNPLYTAPEMKHQFNDAGVEAVVIMDMFMDKLESVITETPVEHVVVASVAQWFPTVVRGIMKFVLRYWNRAIPDYEMAATPIVRAVEMGRRRQAEQDIKVADYTADLGLDEGAVLQYTGGTTGVAKGALLSHGNLLVNMRQLDLISLGYVEAGKDCVVTALPMYHIFAFTVNLLLFYHHGGRNVLVPSPRPIQNCQRALENYPVNWITGVNTLYNALLNEEWFNVYPPKTMKVALAGGTALHQSVAERWQKVVGCPIVEGYGLTESSPLLCFNPISRPRKDSIGIPAPGTEVRLVDDEGQCVPLGEPGELIARGPQIMQGYWHRPEETANTLRDGWLYTGDVAEMEEDGFFRIVDRKKDMILVSGFNVYPNEVEDCLAQLDKVHESAVVGVEDEQSGEAVWAFVVKRDDSLTESELAAHCKTNLAGYKRPRKFIFRDELPKTPVGKVLRKELRAELKSQQKKQQAA
ncbi:long-chain acyl-CoA synthetase [Natronospira proteinivora]|uniref:Long-chain-fatty-acid--CoA ligase n=1 Tax=Natronospira proteinivora TaxID=1807133 RepID=A0ABT1G5G7_9GAMM|nr:AMP-binding protein [Natronospira proteinivora]MCP1726546.1 long-chain acyl-CoA synthetase [Natronospira proteinivora]